MSEREEGSRLPTGRSLVGGCVTSLVLSLSPHSCTVKELKERSLLPSRVFSFEIWDGKEGTHGSKPVGSCFKSEPFLNPAAL